MRFKTYNSDLHTSFIYLPITKGMLISRQPDLLPDVFCLVVRIFRLMLVLLNI